MAVRAGDVASVPQHNIDKHMIWYARALVDLEVEAIQPNA